ncbi:hypothetical protein [Paenibacillus apiarius]|uniref:hypothetical protein n=1 Tax=Paenibacillus apiarius TaxID=46240 RepID=UPI001981DFF1|nr:hypothetical protein [Paenibacillus apiarius]MBN3526403.1 hypothetical protein [Paenibacillus apiarius]
MRLELTVTVKWNFELLDIDVFDVQATVSFAVVTLLFLFALHELLMYNFNK